MRQSLIGFLLANATLLGCSGSPGEDQGLPDRDAPPDHETRHHPARLVQGDGYASLEVNGIGTLDGKVPDGETALERKVVGTWGSGYATEDYPSSHIQSETLELRADGTAVYCEQQGSEHFDSAGNIQTSMSPIRGPWEGTWQVTGAASLEIVFSLPRADEFADR